MTKNPKKYARSTMSGRLEFTSETPLELIRSLTDSGHRQVLLVGGTKLATAFLKLNLVHELWITIEPRLFGQGKPLVLEEKMDIRLRLIDAQQLNESGTMLLRYLVVQE
jgi:dihydrofolate reductase